MTVHGEEGTKGTGITEDTYCGDYAGSFEKLNIDCEQPVTFPFFISVGCREKCGSTLEEVPLVIFSWPLCLNKPAAGSCIVLFTAEPDANIE